MNKQPIGFATVRRKRGNRKAKVIPLYNGYRGKQRGGGMQIASRIAPTKIDVINQVEAREQLERTQKGTPGGYNGWSNWDTWNTMLLLENTQESNRWLNEWNKNFNKKIKSGRFDPVKAEKVVDDYLVPAVRGRKSLQWAVGRDSTPDPDIDPKKVNKAEIVRKIIELDE